MVKNAIILLNENKQQKQKLCFMFIWIDFLWVDYYRKNWHVTNGWKQVHLQFFLQVS